MILIRDLRHLLLDRIETFSTLIDSAMAVRHDDVLKAHRHHELDDGNAGGTSTTRYDLDIMNILADYLQCIDKTRHRDDCGTVLIIMENRNIANLLQLLFNLKAAWCRNVLEINTAEAACKKGNCLHDIIRILRTDAERNRIDITERLEQCALAFHNRHTSLRSDIAKTKHCRTIGYNGNRIPASREVIGLVDILLDLETRLCNTRRISKAQCLIAVDICSQLNLDLTLPLIMLLQ